ncbi:MAG TPA: hypothetical protein VLF19_09005 [Methylomirabilota bacterium]|nr:hypothetical protein [Methylomirabilota bacterium]
MGFSGGSYEEVARWLHNFLTSHAKREHPRLEAVLEAGGEREGHSYSAWLRFGERRSGPMEFDFEDVAGHRGSLAWCKALAEQTRALAREVMAQAPRFDARAR